MLAAQLAQPPATNHSNVGFPDKEATVAVGTHANAFAAPSS